MVKTISKDDQRKMSLRLQTIGLPNPMISAFLQKVDMWVRCSGLDWTVSKLKDLKTDLVRLRSGLRPVSWIRKNRRGQYAGPVGSIIRWSLRTDKNFRRGIQLLNLYTYWVRRDLSPKQKEKFLAGINAPKVPLGDLPSHLFQFTRERFRISKERFPNPDPLITYRGRQSVKAPIYREKKSSVQSENILNELQMFFPGFQGEKLRRQFPQIFEPLFRGIDMHPVAKKPKFDFNHPIHVGKIAFIQEPGYKLRYVASPYRVFQEALRPLGNFLYGVARGLYWDCTHDQTKAFKPVQDALARGITVHSVDLTSATDMFPLELQIAVVRALVGPKNYDYIDLWKMLAQGSWTSQFGELRWNKGQPLGMFPSFAAFTITHGILLWYLNGGVHDGQFYVLGDDVVILDDKLHEKYMECLDRIGCPHSVAKTVSSDGLAEFAGKLITSEWVIPSYKWRAVSDDNFIDLCKALGPRSRRLLRPRQRKIFDMVKHVMEPIGLNFSYPGSNYLDMMKNTLSCPFYAPEEAVLGSLMGLRQRVHKNLHSHALPLLRTNQGEILDILRTFDEKVSQVLAKTIFNRWDSVLEIIDGLASLPEVLGLEPRLPPKELPPSRLSLLERYEAVLSV